MAVLPVAGDQVILEGAFKFRINVKNQQTFSDEFELKIAIPNDFPDNLPMVFEIAGRIPVDGNFHVNPGNQSLCLGSPLRLMDLLSKNKYRTNNSSLVIHCLKQKRPKQDGAEPDQRCFLSRHACPLPFGTGLRPAPARRKVGGIAICKKPGGFAGRLRHEFELCGDAERRRGKFLQQQGR